MQQNSKYIESRHCFWLFCSKYSFSKHQCALVKGSRLSIIRECHVPISSKPIEQQACQRFRLSGCGVLPYQLQSDRIKPPSARPTLQIIKNLCGISRCCGLKECVA